jgi:hypothetical protein
MCCAVPTVLFISLPLFEMRLEIPLGSLTSLDFSSRQLFLKVNFEIVFWRDFHDFVCSSCPGSSEMGSVCLWLVSLEKEEKLQQMRQRTRNQALLQEAHKLAWHSQLVCGLQTAPISLLEHYNHEPLSAQVWDRDSFLSLLCPKANFLKLKIGCEAVSACIK